MYMHVRSKTCAAQLLTIMAGCMQMCIRMLIDECMFVEPMWVYACLSLYFIIKMYTTANMLL